jgi:hypothetical protein
METLTFAVVGDTRPPTVEDVAGYPSEIITKVYAGIAAHTPQPAFVIGTGDYQFSSGFAGGGPDPQLDIKGPAELLARAQVVTP